MKIDVLYMFYMNITFLDVQHVTIFVLINN